MLARLTPFLISAAVTAVCFIDFCAAVFRCGCRSLWAGAGAYCNIHQAASPHCPWCSHGVGGYASVFLLMLVPQLVVSLRVKRGSLPFRALLAVAMFPAAGLVLAFAFGWADRYWDH